MGVVRVDGNILFAAFMITWAVGSVVLYIRFLAMQLVYLRRFPPVEGVPLDSFRGGNPFGARSRAIWRAMGQRQSDLELEQLRREVWRRYRYLGFWIYGFPVLCVAVAALLIVTGVVRLTG